MSGLVSLLSHVGDNKLKYQWLIPSTIKINKKKRETEVTFVTEHENITPDMVMGGNPSKIGMIVWIDADDIESWKNSQE